VGNYGSSVEGEASHLKKGDVMVDPWGFFTWAQYGKFRKTALYWILVNRQLPLK
jgi:hypothetical protein